MAGDTLRLTSTLSVPKVMKHTRVQGTLEKVVMKIRCTWAGDDPLYVEYHDKEWGVPARDDQRLFEFLVLEGAQAGLSWITILRKREAYREAFWGFDPERVARFGSKEINKLLKNPGIVRNRLKLESAVTNARAFLRVQEEYDGFAPFIWQFVGDSPIVNRWKSLKQVPARTHESDRMSKDLQKRGFKFVGSTICYAFMQAVGMVNDHMVDCFRYREIRRSPRSWNVQRHVRI